METTFEKTHLRMRGSVLAFVLLTIVIFFFTGIGMLSLALHSQLQAIRTGKEITARSAADAGLATGLFKINEKLGMGPWSDSSLPQESGVVLPNASTYDFIIEKIDGVYTIESTGTSRAVTRMVRAKLRVAGLFDDGFFAAESMTLGGPGKKISIDGYNSKDGPYSGTNSQQPVSIRTNAISNGAINIAHIDTIYGDITVGVTDHPEDAVIIGNGHITGDIYSGEEVVELLQIIPPSWLTPKPSTDIEGTKTLGPANSGSYIGVVLTEGTLTVEGDVTIHITGVAEIGNVKFVVSDPNSSLTLYVDGSLIGNDGPFVEFDNLTRVPARLQIYGTGSVNDPKVLYQIGSPNGFYGTVYAPNANVELNGDFYGACVANSITQPNPGDIHYDYALKDSHPGEPGARFVVNRWWE